MEEDLEGEGQDCVPLHTTMPCAEMYTGKKPNRLARSPMIECSCQEPGEAGSSAAAVEP